MAKAITSIGTYSNTEAVIRQRLSRLVNDCILLTASAGDKTTYTVATTDPTRFYDKGDDFFNNLHHEVYCYEGTNKGTKHRAYDWVNETHILTVSPAAAADYTTSSKLELHELFGVTEYRDAINQAIAFYARRYFVDLKDETTISLTKTERNDVSGSYIPTYEYALPTDCLWLYRVTTEDSVAGVKLTGTVSGAFTLGETVTGQTSGATGLLSYGPADGYIRVREVDGTFVTGETATGGTSEKTCSSITAVDYETAGNGKFPEENVIDPRDWRVLKPYESTISPKLKLNENHYDVVADLRVRLEYYGIQDDVDSDTDTIMLPPDELVPIAATFLPFSKIESKNLTATFNNCLQIRDEVKKRPPMHPPANARKCW
jgi:hypothetical protein